MSQTRALNIPECSATVVPDDWNAESLETFAPRSFVYYTEKWPYWTVGAALGGVALFCGFLFFLWLCSLCCRRHTWRFELERLPGAIEAYNPNDPYNYRKPKRSRRGCLLYCMTFMLLVTVGFSIWGLVEAILASDNKVSQFWEIIDEAQSQVNGLVASGNKTLDSLQGLHDGLSVLITGALPDRLREQQQQQREGSVGAVLLRSLSGISGEVQQQAQQVQQQVAEALQDGRTAILEIQSQGVQGIQGFEDDWRGPTSSAEQTWRWVVLITFFGLLLLTALMASVLAWWGRTPRTAAGLTLVLYLMTALLMLIGAGVLNGMSEVSGDACLYGEGYAMRLVRDSNGMTPGTKERVLDAMMYYFGETDIPGDKVAKQLFGIDTGMVSSAATAAQPVLEYLESSEGAGAVAEADLPAEAQERLRQLPRLVDGVSQGVQALENQVQRKEWRSVYSQSKTLLCCEIDDGLSMLSIAWTADGCAALILAVLISFRIRALAVWDF